MRTRTTPPFFLFPLFSLSLSLLFSLLLITSPTPAAAELHKAAPADAASLAHLPYQYFHADGYGGNNAACWLSRKPFPTIEGVNCAFAESISQIKGRQIWQCTGDQSLFCQGCHELEQGLSEPKELVQWKVQGC